MSVASTQRKVKVINVQTTDQIEERKKFVQWINLIVHLIARILTGLLLVIILINMSFIGWSQEKQMCFNWMVFLILSQKAFKKIR